MPASDDAGRKPDDDELETLEVEHRARLDQIEADYRAHLAALETLHAHVAPGLWDVYAPNRMSANQAAAERDNMVAREHRRYRDALEERKLQKHVQGGGEPPAATPNNRYGKEYDGAVVEDVVRRATDAKQGGATLGRTLRDNLAGETAATAYAIDTIFRLMRADVLADGGRQGWLKVAGELSATPRFINLHKLETSS